MKIVSVQKYGEIWSVRFSIRVVKITNLIENRTQSTLNVGGSVSSIDFAPCGNKLAAACNNYGDEISSVQIFSKEGSAGTFVCQSTLSGHSRIVNSVSWSPDGTKLASGSEDKTVKVWNPATGEQLCQLKVDGSVYGVAFSPDSTTLAAGLGGPSNSVLIFDAQSGEQLRQLTGHAR